MERTTLKKQCQVPNYEFAQMFITTGVGLCELDGKQATAQRFVQNSNCQLKNCLTDSRDVKSVKSTDI